MLRRLHRRKTRGLSGKLAIATQSDTNASNLTERNLRSKPIASPSPDTLATKSAAWCSTAANTLWASIVDGRPWWLASLDPISNYFLWIWRAPAARLTIASGFLLEDVWTNWLLRNECSADLNRRTGVPDAARSVLRVQPSALGIFRISSILCVPKGRRTIELGSCSRVLRQLASQDS